MKHGQNQWRRPNGGRFDSQRNELFGGRHLQRFGGPAFVLIFVALRFLPALFALIRSLHEKGSCLSFKSYNLLQ